MNDDPMRNATPTLPVMRQLDSVSFRTGLLTRQVRRQMRTTALALSVFTLCALAACGKKDDGQTVGQKLDSAISKTEQAATEAKAKADSSMAKVGESMKADTQKAEASMAKAGASIKEETQRAEASGKKSAAGMSGKFDDVAITTSISAEFAKDADLSAIKIDVDTKNGAVTLYGPAPSPAAREKAANIAKSIKGVTSVDNKLVVKAG